MNFFFAWPQPAIPIFPAVLITYALLVRLLRYRRLRQMQARFPYKTSDGFSTMTLEDAFRIQAVLSELEFPFTFQKALQYALFKTYGFPSMSSLLVRTKQLSTPSTAPKRYVDTEALIVEFCQNHPQSERALAALARMNYLHSVYRKTGAITNDEMLYTLSVFVSEPIRWINDWEWRKLETFEICALATFWKATGDAMDIDYSCLKRSKSGWRDGLEWLDDVTAWATAYEVEHMKPDQSNHQTAEETSKILLWYTPSWAKPLGKQLICAVMDERLRTAMMYEKPPQWCYYLARLVLGSRQYLMRYFALPRPSWLRSRKASSRPNSAGRIYMNLMDAVPFYVRPTLWNRYGPWSWLARAIGVPLPENGKLGSEGFKAEEVGPEAMKGQGQEFARQAREHIAEIRTRGCPFI